jgi:Fe-S cluster biogenesis protein NfuA
MTEQDKPAGVKTVKDRVVETIAKEIEPKLAAHGGSIQLVEVTSDNVVKVRLRGACAGCPGARITLKMGVERLLKEMIPDVAGVVAVD